MVVHSLTQLSYSSSLSVGWAQEEVINRAYALLGPAVDTPLIEPAIGKYVIFLSKRDQGILLYLQAHF